MKFKLALLAALALSLTSCQDAPEELRSKAPQLSLSENSEAVADLYTNALKSSELTLQSPLAQSTATDDQAALSLTANTSTLDDRSLRRIKNRLRIGLDELGFAADAELIEVFVGANGLIYDIFERFKLVLPPEEIGRLTSLPFAFTDVPQPTDEELVAFGLDASAALNLSQSDAVNRFMTGFNELYPENKAGALSELFSRVSARTGMAFDGMMESLVAKAGAKSETFTKEVVKGTLDQVKKEKMTYEQAVAKREAIAKSLEQTLTSAADLKAALSEFDTYIAELKGTDPAVSTDTTAATSSSSTTTTATTTSSTNSTATTTTSSSNSDGSTTVVVSDSADPDAGGHVAVIPAVDTDGDGVLDDSDICPGQDDAGFGHRYKDADGDGYYMVSPTAVCPGGAYGFTSDDLTSSELANLDADDVTFADADSDGVSDVLDVCPGQNDSGYGTRYKDADSDGQYAASPTDVCPGGAYGFVAADLTAWELSNLDGDDSTFADADSDGVADAVDVCAGQNDAGYGTRYKDADSDGYYEASSGDVCPGAGYPQVAADLSAFQLSNLDPDDGDGNNPDNDIDSDGVDNDSDACPGTDDTLMATRYKDDDNDGLVVASGSSVCLDDATYTLAAASLSAYVLANPDGDDATEVIAYDAATITEAAYGSDLNADGDNTDTDVYNVISNPKQWFDFANDCSVNTTASCNDNALIVADLDFADVDGYRYDTVSSDGQYTTTNRRDMLGGGGTSAGGYNGDINGGGHTISNLHYNISGAYLGLVGRYSSTTPRAAISDLTFEGSVISTGSGGYTAGIVGYCPVDYMVLSNVHFNGTVQVSGAYGAGLIGNCHSSYNVSLTISGSSTRGTITGQNGVAGLSANQQRLTITDSYNLADVTSTVHPSTAGGLVTSIGVTGSSITRSFNGGNITGERAVGGIAAWSSTDIDITITDVYNSGTITGTLSSTYSANGIIRAFNSDPDITFTRVYNVGSLIYPNNAYECPILESSIHSASDGSATNVFYQAPTGGSTCTSIGTSKTSGAMKQIGTFTGFDFVNVWNIDADTSCPYLRNVTPSDQKPCVP